MGRGLLKGVGLSWLERNRFLGPLGTAEVDRSNIRRWPFSSSTAGSIDSQQDFGRCPRGIVSNTTAETCSDEFPLAGLGPPKPGLEGGKTKVLGTCRGRGR